MLFFISLGDKGDQQAFLNWAKECYSQQSEEFIERFAPAMSGLETIMNGGDFDSTGHDASGGQRFTGWTTKRHFLIRKEPAETS